MIKLQELAGKHERINAAKQVWECNHCGRKLATRRGTSVHHARDAARNDRETEHKRSCHNFVIFPNDCKAPRWFEAILRNGDYATLY